VPAQEIATSDPDALRLELQEALGSVRHWQMMSVQATGFIVAGNVVLIGYGFTQKQAGMFLLGSVLPVILLALFIITVSAEAGLIVLSLRIEQELHIRKKHSLARTYARSYLRLTGPQLEVIAAQEPRDRNLTRKWFIRPVAIILYAASLGQLGLFVLCFALYNYRFF
jgi:hypothetical protein